MPVLVKHCRAVNLDGQLNGWCTAARTVYPSVEKFRPGIVWDLIGGIWVLLPILEYFSPPNLYKPILTLNQHYSLIILK